MTQNLNMTSHLSKAATKELCPSRKFRTSKQKQRQREIILEIGKLIDMHCRACPKGGTSSRGRQHWKEKCAGCKPLKKIQSLGRKL